MECDNNPQTYSSLDWDLHSFGVLNADMSLVMQTTPFSPSEFSTGYLEDAIFQWNDRCKRRRMLLFGHEHMPSSSDNLLQDCWSAYYNEDPSKNFTYLSHRSNVNISSGNPVNSLINSISDGETMSTEMKAQEGESAHEHLSSSSSSYKDSMTQNSDEKENMITKDPIALESRCCGTKKGRVRVAYPFAVVKPGGIEGDVTLNDINERILMRPTRPVRHPVGDFACVPCVSVDGPGLSGKSVVALTRIHTQGRGTITIIKTRG
ncbi:uncharacterized protein LOC143876791 [Tasmannia lanceolata]|uniref:uncharacterized protein LOC143876791 n=1 Tax=Tasmannia lanceolata TaxID=3420 RepID=UPI00406308C0